MKKDIYKKIEEKRKHIEKIRKYAEGIIVNDYNTKKFITICLECGSSNIEISTYKGFDKEDKNCIEIYCKDCHNTIF